jgi:hypothetical protein
MAKPLSPKEATALILEHRLRNAAVTQRSDQPQGSRRGRPRSEPRSGTPPAAGQRNKTSE